jgi:hypothetical protein
MSAGLKGYQQAITYIYELFDETIDPQARNPMSPT